ncbi:MAG: LOG family protein [Alphaproteobacteria bacterium]|nr:LOG family protein [Alphaproteobacteria bacterium]
MSSDNSLADRPPPHPPRSERRQSLPATRPKATTDDPGATEATKCILASPSYREADQDLDFLQEDETRGLRLQLEYLRAETLLKKNNIAHTIVVFGSTRIGESSAAERHLADCARKLAEDPADASLRQQHAIAERLRDNSRYYGIAREFGRIVGRMGDCAYGGRMMIMTGGGPGIMEAANRGAHDVGAPSIGLNISLPHEQFPNPYITPEFCLKFRYFALRKLHFMLRARALVVFPGGFGTMDELFEILGLSQTRKMPPVPVILVGESYWRRAFNPEFLVDEGVIDPEDRELFWFSESAEAIWRDILRWYELKGEPLCPGDIETP